MLAGKEQRDHGAQVRPVSLPVSQTDIAIQTAGSSSLDLFDERLTVSDHDDNELMAFGHESAAELDWQLDSDRSRLLVPLAARPRPSSGRSERGGSPSHFRRRRSVSLNEILGSSFVHESPVTGERIIISRGWPANARPASRRKGRRRSHAPRPTMDESHKRRLLMEFLQRAPTSAATTVRLGDELELESALKIRRVQASSSPTRRTPTEGRSSTSGEQVRQAAARPLQVQYDLPTHGSEIIELPAAN